MDPETAQHIRETFYAAICFVVLVVAWLYLSHRATDHGPTNWAKWKVFLRARYGSAPVVMASGAGSTKSEPAAEPVRPDPVRPDTHQLKNEELPEEKEALDFAVSHNMSNRELTLIFASQKTLDGKPRWSANDIVKMVGGTRQEVLDTIAIVRPREKPAEEAPKSTTVSPIAGRPINPNDFQDDLELRYQAPV